LKEHGLIGTGKTRDPLLSLALGQEHGSVTTVGTREVGDGLISPVETSYFCFAHQSPHVTLSLVSTW